MGAVSRPKSPTQLYWPISSLVPPTTQLGHRLHPPENLECNYAFFSRRLELINVYGQVPHSFILPEAPQILCPKDRVRHLSHVAHEGHS